MSNNKIFQFKLVLLGESAVGKSSLVLRFVKGQFLDYQESTIGAAFLTQTVCLNDTTVKFEIWDTAGQERYVNSQINQSYFIDPPFFFIFFLFKKDITVLLLCIIEVPKQPSLYMT